MTFITCLILSTLIICGAWLAWDFAHDMRRAYRAEFPRRNRRIRRPWREDEGTLPVPQPDDRSSIELFKRMHDVE